MPTSPQVTAAEIARIAGVGRAAVSNWRRRFADFPQPVGGTDASPTFALSEVERWLRDQGKIAAVPEEEHLWRLIASAPCGPGEALAAVGAHLLGRTSPGPGADPALLRSAAGLATGSGAAPLFADLYARYAESSARAVPAFPAATAALLRDLTAAGREDAVERVLCPAAGAGDLLLAFAGRARVLRGQTDDPALAALAEVRLAFAAGPDGDVAVAAGDALHHDAWPDGGFDAVVCNPPFNDRNWGHDRLAYDPRWEYGLPPRAESELAWVQHALARTRPGGRAVLVMPPAVASRGSGRRIRAELLRRGALRAVIALPAGAAPPAGIALHLWVLEHPQAGTTPTHLLLAEIADAPGNAPEGEPPASGPDALLHAWRAFLADPAGLPATPPPETGAATAFRSVPLLELLDDLVDLTPSHHLPAAAAGHTLERVDGTRDRLLGVLAGLPRLVPAVRGSGPDDPAWRTVTLADLARTGALTLLRSAARSARADSAAEPADDGPPMLTVADLAEGTGPRARAGVDADTARHPEIRRGDVIVPTLLGSQGAGPGTVRVAGHPEEGALLGPNLHLLRPDPAALDPWFLAGFLTDPAGARRAGYGSSIVRLDVRRIEIPLLPPREQAHYGEVFRSLRAFTDSLRQAAELGEQVGAGLLQGLTRGTLRPGPR